MSYVKKNVKKNIKIKKKWGEEVTKEGERIE